MIETEKRVREAVRYLGFGRNEADERTLELIQQSFKDLEQEAGPKSICQIFDLNHTDDGRLVIGQMEIRSKSLSRNLKGCRQVVLFGATLGAGVDRLMRRISLTDMARAVILQSCAAAMLEEYCDECQKKIAAELEEEHLYLRPRFSPGYGDFDICYQEPSRTNVELCKDNRVDFDRQLYDDTNKVGNSSNWNQYTEGQMSNLRM